MSPPAFHPGKAYAIVSTRNARIIAHQNRMTHLYAAHFKFCELLIYHEFSDCFFTQESLDACLFMKKQNALSGRKLISTRF